MSIFRKHARLSPSQKLPWHYVSKAIFCDLFLPLLKRKAANVGSPLRYGVSRVYSQKCVYVLIDAQAAQNNMKALRVVRTAELDPDAGKAR